jgi:hypothetical protein
MKSHSYTTMNEKYRKGIKYRKRREEFNRKGNELE